MKMTVDKLVEALERLSERDWQRVADRFAGGASGEGSRDGQGRERRAVDDRPVPSLLDIHPLRIRF